MATIRTVGGMMRRRPAMALMLSSLFALALLPGSGAAAAPPPAMDPCLDGGAFNIADRDCQSWHPPAWGDQFGTIGSVVTHVARRGDEITIGFNPGADIFYDRPISCGDAGCIYHGLFWRPQDDVIRDTWFQRVDGCGNADESCTFRIWPNREGGDDAERWLVLYVQHYRGIFPQQGVAHAFYVAPRFYPVRVASVDAAGRPLEPRPDAPAYAVRAGRTVTAASCVGREWWVQYRTTPEAPVPDCVELDQEPDPLTGAPGWLGHVPVDSGDWSIVAAPAGDAGSPLLGRATPYRPVSVRPLGDDLTVQAVEETRPRLTVALEPDLDAMPLGSTQSVRLTVAAEGGEAGALLVAFDAPGGLTVDRADPPVLQVLDAQEAPGAPGAPDASEVPDRPFSLAPGTERTFGVRLSAVGLGEGGIEAIVMGTDDLDRPVAADATARIAVMEGTDQPAIGAEAIPPPVVDRAAAAAPDSGDPGHLDGTASGQPGGTVTVTIWTSPAVDGACSARTSGPGVSVVGSTEVTLGDDGTAPFSLDAPLTQGWFAYGVAAVGSRVSRVGDCSIVAADQPTISVADARVAEGTAVDGVTTLDLTVSLSQPADAPVSVHLATRDGSAVSPDDFAALDATEVRFAPGEMRSIVSIPIVPDAAQEGDETFAVVLGDPAGGRLPGPGELLLAEATATIADDDADAVVDTPDVRGVWRWVYRVKHLGKTLTATYTITITEQDPTTGKVSGRIKGDVYEPYPDFTGRVGGTVVGDVVRWKVTGAGKAMNGPIDGTLVRRGGTLGIRIEGINGAPAEVRYLLVEPRGQP